MSTLEANTVKPISGSSTLTLGESGDTVSLGTGVTAGTGVGSDGKILISASDTTANYLQSKIVAGNNFSATLNGSGSNESITFNANNTQMFQAYASADQSISDYSDHDVVFGGEDFDIGSNFASNTFTAPIAGKYVFFVKLQVTNVADWLKIKVVPTGKQYQWFLNPGTASVMCDFGVLVDMAASDTCKVEIVANDNSYTVVGSAGSTYHQSTFSGYLLG